MISRQAGERTVTTVTPTAVNPEMLMTLSYSLQKAAVGTMGMVIGISLITLLRVAAVDGVENDRLQHLADVASGRTQTPRVVVRSDPLCPNLADSGTLAAK